MIMPIMMSQSVLDLGSVHSRVTRTLEGGAQIDLSTEPCRRFLKRTLGKKIDVVVLYVDIDGSTRLSLQLSDRQFARIIQVFSQEMSLVVSSHAGYVFKYVGDAVIALFPARNNMKKASEDAIHCSKTMIEVLESVNPAFKSHGLPGITAKIAFDCGKDLVVPYGKNSKSSYVDIVGRTISVVAKMLPYAKFTRVIAGQALYNSLTDTESKRLFVNSNADKLGWSYPDEKSGYPYRLYSLAIE
jgi:class 3 adenylate cyclase